MCGRQIRTAARLSHPLISPMVGRIIGRAFDNSGGRRHDHRDSGNRRRDAGAHQAVRLQALLRRGGPAAGDRGRAKRDDPVERRGQGRGVRGRVRAEARHQICAGDRLGLGGAALGRRGARPGPRGRDHHDAGDGHRHSPGNTAPEPDSRLRRLGRRHLQHRSRRTSSATSRTAPAPSWSSTFSATRATWTRCWTSVDGTICR